MDKHCQVCFVKTESRFPTKLSTAIQCSVCGLIAHKFCYSPNISPHQIFTCDLCLSKQHDLNTINTPQENTTKGKKKKGKKKQTKKPSKSVCYFCHNEGLLKKINDIWGHPICLLIQPEIFVKSYLTLEFSSLSEFKAKKKKNKCMICGMDGSELVRCFDVQCLNHAHLYCIFRQNIKDSENKKWLQNIGMIGSHFNQIEIFWAHLKKQIKTHASVFYKNIWGSQVLTINEPLKVVHCPNHQIDLINCKCIGDSYGNSESEWIGCDSCDRWYHFECQGILPNSELQESYCCMQCREWHKLLKNNQRPYLSCYPKLYLYDFIYINYYAESNRFKDIDLLNNVIAKNPFLPSLAYLNENKALEIDVNLIKSIKISGIQKLVQGSDIDTLSTKINTKKREVIAQLNRIHLINSHSFFRAVHEVHNKIQWDYQQVRDHLSLYLPKTKKQVPSIKNILKILNRLQNLTPEKKQEESDIQGNEILIATEQLREGISWLKNQRGSNGHENVSKFFQLMRKNPLLLKNIKVNVVDPKISKWQVFSGLFEDYSPEDILNHSILGHLSAKYFKLKKNKMLNLGTLEYLQSSFLAKFQQVNKKIQKNFIKSYFLIYLDLFNREVCDEGDLRMQELCRNDKSVFVYPLVDISRHHRHHDKLLENEDEVTGEKHNISIESIQNEGVFQSYHRIYQSPLKKIIPSRSTSLILAQELKQEIILEKFTRLIKTTKFTKSSLSIIEQEYQHYQASFKDIDKSSSIDQLYCSYLDIHKLFTKLLEALNYEKYHYTVSFSATSIEQLPLTTEITQKPINSFNIDLFSKFYVESSQSNCLNKLDASTQEQYFHKIIDYIKFLSNRDVLIQNKDQFEAMYCLVKAFEKKLLRVSEIKLVLIQFREIQKNYEELMNIGRETGYRNLEKADEIEEKVKMLKRGCNLGKKKNLQFLHDYFYTRFLVHELFEDILINLPINLLLPDFQIPDSYIQKSPKTADIEILRNIIKRIQLINYPETYLTKKLLQIYSEAATQYQIFFTLIKESNLPKKQNGNESSTHRKFTKNEIQLLCKKERLITFQPQILEVEYLCEQYDEKVQKRMQQFEALPCYSQADITKLEAYLNSLLFAPEQSLKDYIHHKKNGSFTSQKNMLYQMYNQLTSSSYGINLSECKSDFKNITQNKLCKFQEQKFVFIQQEITKADNLIRKSKEYVQLKKKSGRQKTREIIEQIENEYRNSPFSIKQVEALLDKMNNEREANGSKFRSRKTHLIKFNKHL